MVHICNSLIHIYHYTLGAYHRAWYTEAKEMPKVWLNGKIVSEQRARVSIRAHALHYGTGVFEGIRFYDTKKGRAIFRLDDHVKRLRYSAAVIGVTNIPPPSAIRKAVTGILRVHPYRSGYIRPIIFFGESTLGLSTHGLKADFAVIVLPWKKYLAKISVSLKTARTRRFNPRAFNPNAKISGVYVNSITAHHEAEQAQCDEALLLGDSGEVAEGAGENIFIVKRGVLYTPPPGNILPGITRKTVFEIAKNFKIPAREKRLRLADLYHADECFLTGTATEVTPVGRIDGKLINRGHVGPITSQIRDRFQEIVHGRAPKYWHLLTFVD